MNDSPSLRNPIAPHLRAIPRSGIRDFFDIVNTRDDVISLSIGEPDFLTPWHIRAATIDALEKGLTSYTSNLGSAEARNAVSRYVERSYGLSYSPVSEILITVGVSEALDLAVRALVSPGDEVAYHEPCYVSYSPVVAFAHAVPVAVPTRPEDGFKLRADALKRAITQRTRVLLLNFPTNPTGAAMTLDELEPIARLAVEHDLTVISDEIYSELTYNLPRGSIATLPGMKERTIFLNGCSKAWSMTGFRLGFSCAPANITEAMMKIHQYTMLCAPTLSQKAAVEALDHGDEDIEEMREDYRRRRQFICSQLNAMGLPCHVPDGAFYVFPDIRGFGLNSREFALRLLDEQNVACVPGSAFGATGEGFLRCSYASALDDIEAAMPRMAAFVRSLKRQ